MSDLGRIESTYGSVAEYNRSRAERESRSTDATYTPTQREWDDIEQDISTKMSDALIERLSVPVSDNAKKIRADYDEALKGLDFPRDRDKSSALRHDTMMRTAGQYGVQFKDEPTSVAPGQFSVSYEYTSGSRIHYKYSTPIDKDEFFQAYEDLYSMNSGLVVKYRDTSGRGPDMCGRPGDVHTISNSSLAAMRLTDFKHWGVDDPEGQQIIHDTKAEFKGIRDKARADFKAANKSRIEAENAERAEFGDIGSPDDYGY